MMAAFSTVSGFGVTRKEKKIIGAMTLGRQGKEMISAYLLNVMAFTRNHKKRNIRTVICRDFRDTEARGLSTDVNRTAELRLLAN